MTIEIVGDESSYKMSAYEIKNGKKQMGTINFSNKEIVNFLINEEIKRVEFHNEDISFEWGDILVLIKNSNEIKNNPNLDKLIEKIQTQYRKQKLAKRKVSRRVKRNRIIAIIIAGALAIGAIGISLIAKNKKGEQPEVPKEPKVDIVDIYDTGERIPQKIEEEVYIDYEDRTSTSKLINTEENYMEFVEKYSEEYGLDANLMIAIATQERGVHSTTVDPGGGFGLFQIQQNVWEGATVSAWNFVENRLDKKFITVEDLADLETNVKIACMIFRTYLDQMQGNIPAAIQCYNFGPGSMSDVLEAYGEECGKTRQEILEDQTDVNWLNYRNIISGGDKQYVEHVLSYLRYNHISMLDSNGKHIVIGVRNQLNKAIRS